MIGHEHPAADWLKIATVHWYVPAKGDDFADIIRRKTGWRLDRDNEELDGNIAQALGLMWDQVGMPYGLSGEEFAERARLVLPWDEIMLNLSRELEAIVGPRGWLFDRQAVEESKAEGDGKAHDPHADPG